MGLERGGLTNLVLRMIEVAGAEVVGISRLDFDPRAFSTSIKP